MTNAEEMAKQETLDIEEKIAAVEAKMDKLDSGLSEIKTVCLFT
jgi:hypothetical protein